MKLMTFAGKLFKAKGDKLPVICIFGCKDVELVTPTEKRTKRRDWIADVILPIPTSNRFSCRTGRMSSSRSGTDRPTTILIKAPFEIRRRWLHYDTLPDLERLGISAYDRYLKNMFDDGKAANEKPLVTVFTPAYKSGEKSTAVPFPPGTDLYQLGMGHRG